MQNKKENPFLNLGFNIFLPVLILNKAQSWIPIELSSTLILLIALLFPFLYGLKDFITDKKINIISIIGLVSIALTGGFALLKLEGIYFAIKEAAVPLAFAGFAVITVYLKKPLINWMIIKSNLFATELIQQNLELQNNQKAFNKLMSQSTLLLSASFVLSAILNFIVAIYVFTEIDPNLIETAKAEILNKQVADMTWMGYLFIALPLTGVTGVLMYWIVKTLKKLTGLSLDEMLSQQLKK